MSDDEQFNEAFGEHTGISQRCRDCINDIRQIRRIKDFSLHNEDRFMDLSWRLLGRYISNNSHLEKVVLINCGITDEKMASFFYELTYSTSLKELYLCGNSFGIEGVQSMIPFLTDTNLSYINLARNNINTDCFELLVQTMHGRPSGDRTFEFHLNISECGITNISALDTYTLQNIQQLNLSDNNIGREGCITISNLLQQEGSNLIYLDLENTGMGDEEAELLATSLKHNTKLEILYMANNNITEKGEGAFLQLLVDASSIKNTYNSNYTLTYLRFDISTRDKTTMIGHINSAVQLNKLNQSSRHSAGRAKVIRYQLNSINRKNLCRLQGIDYSSIGNLFADIEPVLLPRTLALTGREHGQSDFYTALISMVPDLMSCVDTSGMMKALLMKDEARATKILRYKWLNLLVNKQLFLLRFLNE